MQKKRFLLIVVLVILVIIVSAPLFTKGLFTSQDGEKHLIRIGYFHKEILRGNPIPKWISELNNGLGYPVFFFNYPLPYYLAVFWRIMGVSIIDSLKITLLLATMAGALGVYLWTKEFSSAVIYLFTPYRFLDIFVRLSYGEFIALCILPFCFFSVGLGNLFLISISMAFLLLSHGHIFVIFTPILLLYSFLKRRVRLFLFGLLLALGLSAFYWLPAAFLVSHTKFNLVHQFPPADHLPTFRELIYSKWGFGLSHPGPFDEMSFQLGIVNWIILIWVTIIAFKSEQQLAKFLAITIWFSILIMSTNPFHFWNQPFIQFIQFPWRLLSVSLILTPLALVVISPPRLILAILLTLAIYTNRNHITTNMPWFSETSDQYFLTNGSTTTSTPDENMPKNPYPEVKYEFINHPSIPISYTISSVSIVCLIVIMFLRNKWSPLQS